MERTRPEGVLRHLYRDTDGHGRIAHRLAGGEGGPQVQAPMTDAHNRWYPLAVITRPCYRSRTGTRGESPCGHDEDARIPRRIA